MPFMRSADSRPEIRTGVVASAHVRITARPRSLRHSELQKARSLRRAYITAHLRSLRHSELPKARSLRHAYIMARPRSLQHSELLKVRRPIMTQQGKTAMALVPRILGVSQLAAEHISAAKRSRVPPAVFEHRTGCSNRIYPYRTDQ
ncbi:hypothetical protein Taro_015097, partial [Colocasia esculenta]|nr:hypothetical protein [Colocasia esculenta]